MGFHGDTRRLPTQIPTQNNRFAKLYCANTFTMPFNTSKQPIITIHLRISHGEERAHGQHPPAVGAVQGGGAAGVAAVPRAGLHVKGVRPSLFKKVVHISPFLPSTYLSPAWVFASKEYDTPSLFTSQCCIVCTRVVGLRVRVLS